MIATATIEATTVDTPVGPLSVLCEPAADTGRLVIVAAGFCPTADLRARLSVGRQEAPLTMRSDLGEVTKAVTDYLDGHVDAFDHLAIDQPGTDLQQQVWDGLRAIPAGETRTYTQLAAATAKPNAVRAAGTACGRNLVAPMVPCHRALRTDGSLGGYYYGLDVKRWLLDHEARSAAA
ncbi:MAG: methylated-DNA--[protein]-cysteine S-methyltransferase [Actinomycetota bacterium]